MFYVLHNLMAQTGLRIPHASCCDKFRRSHDIWLSPNTVYTRKSGAATLPQHRRIKGAPTALRTIHMLNPLHGWVKFCANNAYARGSLQKPYRSNGVGKGSIITVYI